MQTMNTDNFSASTGRSWEQWLAFLTGIGAGKLSHTEIAQKVFDTGDASGWWSQSITVAYEQHIGRRVPGQDADGSYAVSATKTLTGTMDQALARWTALVGKRRDFNSVPMTGTAEHSATEKWRYWRCALADGTRVKLTIFQKTRDKAGLAIEQAKLQSAEAIEPWRSFWKGLLRQLS